MASASGDDKGNERKRRRNGKPKRKRRSQGSAAPASPPIPRGNPAPARPTESAAATGAAPAQAKAKPAAADASDPNRKSKRLPVITAKAFAMANSYAAEFNRDARALCDCPAGCGCDCILACVYMPACDCVCVGEAPDLMRLGDYMTMAQAQIALDDGIELDDVLDAPVSEYGDRIDELVARIDYRALFKREMEETADGVVLNSVALKTPTGRDATLIHANGDFAVIRVIARCSEREVAEIERMPVDEYMALWNWVGKVSRVSIETPW